MAERIEAFEVSTPNGTLETAPLRTPLVFNDGIVTALHILVPPGPSGFLRFRIEYGGEQVIPITPGEFLVADNEVIRWDVSRYPTGRAWETLTFNTDIYPHSIFLRFLIDEFRTPARQLPTPVPIPAPDIPGQETFATIALISSPPPLED